MLFFPAFRMKSLVSLNTAFHDLLTSYGINNYWRLNETSGTTAVDSMGNDDGSYTGTFSLAQSSLLSSDPDLAVSFTVGSFLADGTAPTSWQAESATYGGLYFIPTLPEGECLFHVGNSTISNRQGVFFTINVDGSLDVGWYNAGFQNVTTAPAVIAANTVLFIVFRFNSTSSIDIIVNGVKTSVSLSPVALLPENQLTFGGFRDATVSNQLTGKLDECFAALSLLTDEEIANLYAVL